MREREGGRQQERKGEREGGREERKGERKGGKSFSLKRVMLETLVNKTIYRQCTCTIQAHHTY